MNLITQLSSTLIRLIGFSSSTPRTVALSGPDGISLAIDFVAVDSMSCSLREIRLQVPSLVDADFDKLKTWGEDLCRRVTYLLENIGPLELDPDGKQVLIRSNPPNKQDGKTTFYEIVLQSHSGGNFTLRRYQADKDTPGHAQIDIQTTHEVLKKLVSDLIATIP